MKHRQSKSYFDHLKHQTIRNKLKILNYNIRHNEEFSPYPLNAKIEINGTCNLDCVMCLRKSLPNREKFMSKKQFFTTLDHLPALIEWSPHGYNEPMLHPEFFDFIKETKDRHITLGLVTNGTVLNQTNADKLIALEPRYIRFSIDAVGWKYEEIRKGADYNQVCKNLKYVVENYAKEKVLIYATIWKENIDQIPYLQRLADYLGIKITFNDITWKNNYGQSTQENSLRENDIFVDIINGTFKQSEKRKCTLPWSSIYIDVVGNCYPCTDTLKYFMGNIFTTHIKNIFNSPEFKKFRRNSLDGNNYECKNCLAWGPKY